MQDAPVTNGMTITRAATRCGVRPDTIRYYERIGLLPPAARTTGDHRRYNASTIDRLLFIRGAQQLDLTLAEIRELLAVRDTGTCTCGPAETLLRRHLDAIDTEMTRIATLRGELTSMLAHMPGPDCRDPEPGTWCPPVEDPHEGR